MQTTSEGKRKSIGTLSTFSGPTKSISDSFGSLSDRDTTFSVRDSTIAPSIAEAPPAEATPASSSSSSSSSSSPPASDDEEQDVGGSGKSQDRSDWAGGSGPYKKVESRSDEDEDDDDEEVDSDAWHSESEANWTLVEASFRNGRDISQSQVLSEGQDICYSDDVAAQRRPSVTFDEHLAGTKVQQKGTLPPFSEGEEMQSSADLRPRMLPMGTGGVASSMPPPPSSSPPLPPAAPVSEADVQEYGFLPRRPTEVFGDCSWNALPLAISSNLVKAKEKRSESIFGQPLE